MESDLLPSAASAHEAANSAYRRGVLRLTDVLDAQRTLFEIRRRTIDTLVRCHTAAFEIERLTGMPAVDSDSKEQR
jgi:cobalt-zinc-cadmium efflux system outer membrane protein